MINDEQILNVLDTFGTLHTSEVAEELDAPLSTVRRRLSRLEDHGCIRGIKHDERDLFSGGRIRVYWSRVER